MHHEVLRHTINQLFTSAQHLLLLIIGLHVSTDHSVIFRSLVCCKFQGAVLVDTLDILRICMGLVLMYLQVILTPYTNECV